jgi:hypothetical protein
MGCTNSKAPVFPQVENIEDQITISSASQNIGDTLTITCLTMTNNDSINRITVVHPVELENYQKGIYVMSATQNDAWFITNIYNHNCLNNNCFIQNNMITLSASHIINCRSGSCAILQMFNIINEQNNDVPTPLNDDGIKKLKHIYSKDLLENDLKKCVICFDPYESDSMITELPCKHNYHKKCIDKHFKTKHFCPLCRDDLHEEKMK